MSILFQLEKQLFYVNKTIQPFFSLRQGVFTDDTVSRSKLTDLWLHKRKKAIQIIKNDCTLPNKTQIEIDQAGTEAFDRNEKLFLLESDTGSGEEIS